MSTPRRDHPRRSGKSRPAAPVPLRETLLLVALALRMILPVLAILIGTVVFAYALLVLLFR
ncbi:MAG: hypothetical protein EA427_01705 [Spirochaetaceae bacterium]|nr:MAG: hypothetical protein EA427_01705 [Spirochaetaceae bacterium]